MSLESLPANLINRIVSFLGEDDRFRLQSCSRTLLKKVEKTDLHLGGYYHTLKLIGNGNAVTMEVGVFLRVKVPYERFDELIEIKEDLFNSCYMEIGYITNRNRVLPEQVEMLLEQYVIKSVCFEIRKEDYHVDVLPFIQRLESRSTIQLEMHNFTLTREQLLSLKPTGNMRVTGDIPPIANEVFLELVSRRHSSISLSNIAAIPETVRDAFKIVSAHDGQQHVVISVLESVFLELIGIRLIEEQLVMEDPSTGFTIANDGFYDEDGKRKEYCCGDYCIVYENAHCMMYQEWEEDKKNEWSLTIVRTLEDDRDEDE